MSLKETQIFKNKSNEIINLDKAKIEKYKFKYRYNPCVWCYRMNETLYFIYSKIGKKDTVVCKKCFDR